MTGRRPPGYCGRRGRGRGARRRGAPGRGRRRGGTRGRHGGGGGGDGGSCGGGGHRRAETMRPPATTTTEAAGSGTAAAATATVPTTATTTSSAGYLWEEGRDRAVSTSYVSLHALWLMPRSVCDLYTAGQVKFPSSNGRCVAGAVSPTRSRFVGGGAVGRRGGEGEGEREASGWEEAPRSFKARFGDNFLVAPSFAMGLAAGGRRRAVIGG